MEPLQRVTADELETLQMENELLRYEVEHLRARLAEHEAAVATRPAEPRPSQAQAPADVRAQEAERDLVWLLQRLDETPLLGQALRRRAGFRALHDRYVDPGPGAP